MPVISATAIEELKLKAKKLRKDVISMIYRAASGHPGGALSALDILIVLYYTVMNIDPKNYLDIERDRLVLSKGHACPALYAVLADRGFFPSDWLDFLRKIDSLQGHPDMRRIPGIEMSAGSWAGPFAANGMALAARRWLRRRVYVILGDGEIQEGQVWEAAMTAAHYRLDNLTAFLITMACKLTVDQGCKVPGTAGGEVRAFGWHVLEVDGHDYTSLLEIIDRAIFIKALRR